MFARRAPLVPLLLFVLLAGSTSALGDPDGTTRTAPDNPNLGAGDGATNDNGPKNELQPADPPGRDPGPSGPAVEPYTLRGSPGPGTQSAADQPPAAAAPQRSAQDGGLLSAPSARHSVADDALQPQADAALPKTASAAKADAAAPASPASSASSGGAAGSRLALDAGRLSAPAPSAAAAGDWLAQAQRLTSISDYAGALKALDQAVRLDPSNVAAWTRRAGTLNKLTRYQEAAADAQSALKLETHNPQAWRELAWARLRSGDLRGAVDAATQALALNPNDAVAYAVRARARWALGDKAGALADAEAAARLDARFSRLAEAMRSGQYVDSGESSWADDAARPSSAPSPRSGKRWPLLALLAALGAGAAAALWRARSLDARLRAFGALAKRDGGVVGGKYELRRLIGRGGMGEVHEAFDRSLRRSVALKKVSASSEADPERLRQLIVSEATTVAALHHPNIVDIYEILDGGSDLYLVFELVRGQTLAQILSKNGSLELEEALAIIDPVCRALQFAHDRRLIHRDLKPANIMITEDGFVKLMDFGIARSLESSGLDARTRTVMGTPLYMAPEMESGRVSKEGDIYALGVTLYEMLIGTPPFQSVVQKVMLDFAAPSSRKPGLPPEVDALILAALQPDPAKRLRSAGEFLTALTAAARGSQTPPARVAA